MVHLEFVYKDADSVSSRSSYKTGTLEMYLSKTDVSAASLGHARQALQMLQEEN